MSISWSLDHILTAPLTGLAIILLVLCSFFLLECFFSLFTQNNTNDINSPTADEFKLAILIPAHNESSGIQQTIETIKPQLRQQDCLMIVADNCSDDTATVARQAGAVVIERQDPDHRGKGYALDFGLQHLATVNPPDIVIFVDADCSVDQGTISSLASQAVRTNRPVQATYLMEKPQDDSLKSAVSAFAFKVKNMVRPLGLANLRQPCLLTGTGIAMPWAAVQTINLATSSIVEDMRLGLDLALGGYSPVFNSQAQVTSRLPEGEKATITQRTRWEHGHLQIAAEYVPRLLKQAFTQARFDLLALALEVAILPLSLLLLLSLLVLICSLVAAFTLHIWLPVFVIGLAIISLCSGLFIAWGRHGRTDITLKELLTIPSYIVWKIPLYFKYFINPERNWIRTERDTP